MEIFLALETRACSFIPTHHGRQKYTDWRPAGTSGLSMWNRKCGDMILLPRLIVLNRATIALAFCTSWHWNLGVLQKRRGDNYCKWWVDKRLFLNMTLRTAAFCFPLKEVECETRWWKPKILRLFAGLVLIHTHRCLEYRNFAMKMSIYSNENMRRSLTSHERQTKCSELHDNVGPWWADIYPVLLTHTLTQWVSICMTMARAETLTGEGQGSDSGEEVKGHILNQLSLIDGRG